MKNSISMLNNGITYKAITLKIGQKAYNHYKDIVEIVGFEIIPEDSILCVLTINKIGILRHYTIEELTTYKYVEKLYNNKEEV